MKPGSLWGLSKMVKKVQKEHMDSEIAQMFKPIKAREQRKHMEKIKCYPQKNGRDFSWQGDLAVFPGKGGTRYLLLFIDCFSRKLFYHVTTGKSNKVLLPPVMALLRKHRPKRITFDMESAIMSNEMKEFLQKEGITMYNTRKKQPNDFKGRTYLVERAIRTIKSQVFKHKRAFGGPWDKFIAEIITSYNSSFHRSIKTTPNEAYESQQTFEDNSKTVPELPLGTKVRIMRTKAKFEKGTTANWSKQVYLIWSREGLKYRVSTKAGGVHPGVFGRQHLQVVTTVVKAEKRSLKGKTLTLKLGGRTKAVIDVSDADYVAPDRGPRRSSRLAKRGTITQD